MPASSELLYLNTEEMDALSWMVEHLSIMCEDLDSIFSTFSQAKTEKNLNMESWGSVGKVIDDGWSLDL